MAKENGRLPPANGSAKVMRLGREPERDTTTAGKIFQALSKNAKGIEVWKA